jgi:hypothetical protein|tara:strand:+ start:771 stop:1406 length:636 start_codon:yes stop_codon:yes gene_type:complete
MNFNVLSIDIDWCQSHFHIEQMNKVFYENMCTAKRIVFSHHHHQIVPEIIHEDNIVLHNIDHHHDIQYDDWQVDDIEKGKSTHGCWVGNMIQLDKIKEYVWYNNINSHTEYTTYVDDMFRKTLLPFSIERHLDRISDINSYDLLFICLSPEYSASATMYQGHQGALLYQCYLDACKSLHNSKTTETRLVSDMRNTPIYITRNPEGSGWMTT